MNAEPLEFQPIQERDRIATRSLARIAVGAVAVGMLAVAAAALLLRAEWRMPSPVTWLPRAIGTADFEEPPRGLELAAAQRADLDTLGWADRDAGLARIPIERALDLFARRERFAEAPLVVPTHTAGETP
jgi:hypothetical protein